VYRLSCLAGDSADLAHLPEDIRPPRRRRRGERRAPVLRPAASPASLAEAKRAASDEAERACLERGLKDVGGTVAELARRWDMNRSHLQILLKKHGLHSKDFRQRAN
jgi:DNA-binding NtrC family response regulator